MNAHISQSDAQINDFTMLGLGASHSFKLNQHGYKFTPKISIKQYTNLTYLTLPRDDRNIRVDFNINRPFLGGRVHLDINIALEDNESDHPIFVYDNTEFIAGLSCNW